MGLNVHTDFVLRRTTELHKLVQQEKNMRATYDCNKCGHKNCFKCDYWHIRHQIKKLHNQGIW